MDLLSLVLNLKPLDKASPSKPLPLWWGRAAHALLLNIIRQADPQLAASLHPSSEKAQSSSDMQSHQPEIRPFTVSNLLGSFPSGDFKADARYTLRFTAFRQDIAEILSQAVLAGALAAGRKVELDYYAFEIQSASWGSQDPRPENAPDRSDGLNSNAVHLWTGCTTYSELGASYLLGKITPPKRIALQLTSPVAFKSAGKHIPLPLPDLVFGSLLERWNAYSPIAFPAEVRRYAAECLAISRFQLSSRSVPVKSGGLRIGSVGQVTFTTTNYDRYWMSVCAVLAAFSLYSGIGAGTTMGLGQCRMQAGLPSQ